MDKGRIELVAKRRWYVALSKVKCRLGYLQIVTMYFILKQYPCAENLNFFGQCRPYHETLVPSDVDINNRLWLLQRQTTLKRPTTQNSFFCGGISFSWQEFFRCPKKLCIKPAKKKSFKRYNFQFTINLRISMITSTRRNQRPRYHMIATQIFGNYSTNFYAIHRKF